MPIFLLPVTCDGLLSFGEAAPEVIRHGHQQYELSLKARQLVPPIMPVCHVLGALKTGSLSLLLISVVEDTTFFRSFSHLWDFLSLFFISGCPNS